MKKAIFLLILFFIPIAYGTSNLTNANITSTGLSTNITISEGEYIYFDLLEVKAGYIYFENLSSESDGSKTNCNVTKPNINYIRFSLFEFCRPVVAIGSTTSSGTSMLDCNAYSDLYKKCYYKENNMCFEGCLSGYICNSSYRCELSKEVQLTNRSEVKPLKIVYRARSDLDRFVSYLFLRFINPPVKKYLNGSWIMFGIAVSIIVFLIIFSIDFFKKK